MRYLYYGYRHYDPLTMAWTQGDPMYRFAPELAFDEPRRMNLYAFSLNNPLRYVDPDGEDPKEYQRAMAGDVAAAQWLVLAEIAKNPGLFENGPNYQSDPSKSYRGHTDKKRRIVTLGKAAFGAIEGLGITLWHETQHDRLYQANTKDANVAEDLISVNLIDHIEIFATEIPLLKAALERADDWEKGNLSAALTQATGDKARDEAALREEFGDDADRILELIDRGEYQNARRLVTSLSRPWWEHALPSSR